MDARLTPKQRKKVKAREEHLKKASDLRITKIKKKDRKERVRSSRTTRSNRSVLRQLEQRRKVWPIPFLGVILNSVGPYIALRAAGFASAASAAHRALTGVSVQTIDVQAMRLKRPKMTDTQKKVRGSA